MKQKNNKHCLFFTLKARIVFGAENFDCRQ